MTKSKSKREGQHHVRAVIRVYSGKGVTRIQKWLDSPRHTRSSYQVYGDRFTLVEVLWQPRPIKNEFNTQSDWRKDVASWMTGLYFDVLAVEYDWTPLT